MAELPSRSPLPGNNVTALCSNLTASATRIPPNVQAAALPERFMAILKQEAQGARHSLACEPPRRPRAVVRPIARSLTVRRVKVAVGFGTGVKTARMLALFALCGPEGVWHKARTALFAHAAAATHKAGWRVHVVFLFERRRCPAAERSLGAGRFRAMGLRAAKACLAAAVRGLALVLEPQLHFFLGLAGVFRSGDQRKLLSAREAQHFTSPNTVHNGIKACDEPRDWCILALFVLHVVHFPS
mmetsp:Transcript_15426/g.38881  ORF Transcript_15426/g.38881 Transcript_15426/m.38881 type:complete len:243 (-) Transcript_15426:21-749(-)